jgi:hypothetical protein
MQDRLFPGRKGRQRTISFIVPNNRASFFILILGAGFFPFSYLRIGGSQRPIASAGNDVVSCSKGKEIKLNLLVYNPQKTSQS